MIHDRSNIDPGVSEVVRARRAVRRGSTQVTRNGSRDDLLSEERCEDPMIVTINSVVVED
jgi:hypothetical protein